ncbi:MAG: DUF5362 domain-containing protein [bacterium]|nr:DUF5362 domain-containing protein [bacterium]
MQDPTIQTAAQEPFNHPMGPGFGATLADMRFMGWVSLIYGIITCLSIVGALVGVPMIIAAHRFIEGINRFEVYRQDRSEGELRTGFHELGRSFRIQKILVVIHLVLTVGYFCFLFLLGGLGILAELAGT